MILLIKRFLARLVWGIPSKEVEPTTPSNYLQSRGIKGPLYCPIVEKGMKKYVRD